MIIKSAIEIAKKWMRVTSGRTDDYEAGVRNPQRDWATETGNAQDRYNAGIKAAILRGAFKKGVDKVGTTKQKSKTIIKGIPRWAEGVSLAENDMRISMEPVVATLEKVELPKRYETGDPRNLKRVEAVTTALHKMKIGA